MDETERRIEDAWEAFANARALESIRDAWAYRELLRRTGRGAVRRSVVGRTRGRSIGELVWSALDAAPAPRADGRSESGEHWHFDGGAHSEMTDTRLCHSCAEESDGTEDDPHPRTVKGWRLVDGGAPAGAACDCCGRPLGRR